jgi:hypothetical protein
MASSRSLRRSTPSITSGVRKKPTRSGAGDVTFNANNAFRKPIAPVSVSALKKTQPTITTSKV